MAQERGQHAKLARLAEKLEGGIVAQTTSAEALYIPAGCLHAVFTMEGGFLASIDCTTRLSVWPFSQYLRYQLHLALDTTGQGECFFLFLESLETSLANSQELLALRSWISIEDLLQQHADHDIEWRTRAASIWQQYRKSTAGATLKCPSDQITNIASGCQDWGHTSWLFEKRIMPKHRSRRNDL